MEISREMLTDLVRVFAKLADEANQRIEEPLLRVYNQGLRDAYGNASQWLSDIVST